LNGSIEVVAVESSNLDKYGKVILDDIYNERDPRAYFSTLNHLEYRIPQAAKPIFEEVFAAYRLLRGGGELKIADIGCSYGVNAALLKHHFDMKDLYHRYAGGGSEAIERAGMIRRDRRDFSGGGDPSLEFVGVDQAAKAVAYADETDILDHGIVADLESEVLDAESALALSGSDLVISTGCVGYVGERTFRQIFHATGAGRPWFANFVLRMFSFAPLERLFADKGYVTEKAGGRLFRQRRYASPAERTEVMARLRERGVAARGEEASDWLCAEFFLSRPAADAARLPLAKILSEG